MKLNVGFRFDGTILETCCLAQISGDIATLRTVEYYIILVEELAWLPRRISAEPPTRMGPGVSTLS